jgi:hypothetical protein
MNLARVLCPAPGSECADPPAAIVRSLDDIHAIVRRADEVVRGPDDRWQTGDVHTPRHALGRCGSGPRAGEPEGYS